MEGFKRRFYTTSKNLERKPESNHEQFSFLRPQQFSQSQQPEETEKSAESNTYINSNLIREDKKVDEACSSLEDLGFQSFQPDEYDVYHQSVSESPGRGQEVQKGK